MNVSGARIDATPGREAPRSAMLRTLFKPGMAFLRRFDFRVKALWVSLCFILPMTLLTVLYGHAVWSELTILGKEREGVAFLRSALPLLQATQQARALEDRARMEDPGTQTSRQNAARVTRDRLEALKSVNASVGQSLATSELMEALIVAVEAQLNGRSVAAAPGSAGGATDAVLNLVRHVSRTSGLVLDSDERSFRLMQAAVIEMPDILVSASEIRQLGAELLTRDDQKRLRILVDRIARLDVGLDRLDDAYSRAVELMPEVDVHVQSAPAVAGLRMVQESAQSEAIEGRARVDAPTFYKHADHHLAGFYELADRSFNALDAVLAERLRGHQQRALVSALTLAGGLLLACYLFTCFFLVTSHGYRAVERHLLALARGDLRQAPSATSGRDESARMLMALGQSHQALSRLIARLSQLAGHLDAASSEVSSAARDLARRTDIAAAALEQQSATISEMGSSADDTARQAERASELAAQNAAEAERSGLVIVEVSETMRGIQATSSRIGDIVSLIDGIAFRTNILALNAAVEAARAGESGRGFAVVAGEVRQLAQRSAQAAREIKTLIQSSTARVSDGARIVEQAGRSIALLVRNAGVINDQFALIARSAAEQARCVEEINLAIRQLDSDTQQNAALVEQTSASAHALRHQAEAMRQSVSSFRID